MKIRNVLGVIALTAAFAGLWTGVAAESEKPAAPREPRERAGGRAEQVKERVDQLATELKLSEEQKGKIRTVLQRQAGKTRELRADQSLTPEQRREKMMGIRQEIQKEVKGILNEEQFKKWTEIRGQARDGRARAPGAPGERPPGRRGQGGAAPEESK